MKRGFLLTSVTPLLAGGVACATGQDLGESETNVDTTTTGGTGGSGRMTAPEPTAGTGAVPMTTGGFAGQSGAGGAPISSGGAGGGTTGPCANAGEKECGGICVAPDPTFGCALDDGCTPCPTVTNGQAVCTGSVCDAVCDPGFVNAGGSCVSADSGFVADGGGAGGSGGAPTTDGGCLLACPQGTECGSVDDQCGGSLSCGTCGGSEACISGTCTPVTGGGFGYTPSNFDPNDSNIDTSGLSGIVLDCGVSTFDSETLQFGNWCGQQTPTPVLLDGDTVVLLPVPALTIASGATLDIDGTRPVIIAAYGDVAIDGSVDADANSTSAGPGGNVNCGTSAGEAGSGSGGGGGGGFLTAGASGGDSTSSNGGGGDPRGNPELIPLVGGCPGGDAPGGAGGGGGGGAIQISAAGSLSVGGSVTALGGTGETGGNLDPGAGGGSGGAILLEGDQVTVSGAVAANGGDGGNSDQGSDGVGGTGGTQSSPPTAGGSQGADAGGGGGSAGIIRINSVN